MFIKKTLSGLDASDREKIKKTGTFVIPTDIHEIGDSAFCECEGLERIIIPSNIINILQFAFLDCRDLKEVKIEGGAYVISRDAFTNCKIERLILGKKLSKEQALDRISKMKVALGNNDFDVYYEDSTENADESEKEI